MTPTRQNQLTNTLAHASVNLLKENKAMLKELQRIEAIDPDDDGSRIIPPGFLDRARELMSDASYNRRVSTDLVKENKLLLSALKDCLRALTDDTGNAARREYKASVKAQQLIASLS